VQRISVTPISRTPFFGVTRSLTQLPGPQAWKNAANYFGWFRPPHKGAPPDWHSNPFNGAHAVGPERDWWKISDFDPAVGDIKAVWEASRFDWVVNLAQHAKIGSEESLERLNLWLANWCNKNPPYQGHNWKCAQEASIRVMHLALAALFLDAIKCPMLALSELVTLHLRRIEPTLSYAIAQDNNHGTSEAAALFIGGSWLDKLGHPQGQRWHSTGTRLLHDRTRRLIARDGSFSQYSVNYHRLMLDTLGLAEVWRRHCELPPFAEELYSRAASASAWLRAMVDPATGAAPNLGANDGANLLQLTDADYRDYRPSVQLGTAVFEHMRAYDRAGPWEEHLNWLSLSAPVQPAPPAVSKTFDDGGFVVLQRGDAKVVFRYPRFRFRPSHSDALHIDLWKAGINLLRDSGSYSYGSEPEWQNYFPGVRAHNTVQFDDRDQMPRLGRFLWGDWLRTDALTPIQNVGDVTTVTASYTDSFHAVHVRSVELADESLTVLDQVRGFASRAVLRWRLRPGPWKTDGTSVTDGHHRLTVSANTAIIRCELVCGWESRYYMQKTEVPVLEVEIQKAGSLTSRYHWS
jgi:hypothetical protein